MDKSCRLSRLDWLLLCAITVLYSLFALHDLGSRVAPENAMTLGPDCGYCFVFSESPLPCAGLTALSRIPGRIRR